jgi:hypothetical protein
VPRKYDKSLIVILAKQADKKFYEYEIPILIENSPEFKNLVIPSLYLTRLSDWIRRDKDDLPGYNVYHPSQSTDRIGSSSDDLPGNRANRPSPAATQSADLPGYVILRPSQAARVASRSSRATVDERKNDIVGRPIKTYY